MKIKNKLPSIPPATPDPRHRPLMPAFTLVELLVVITIVTVLATVVFTVSSRVRQTAMMTTSMNRIKSLAIANTSYAADHAGRYVPILSFDDHAQGTVQWHFNPEFLSTLIGDVTFLDGVTGLDGVGGFPESVLDPKVVNSKAYFWDRISASYAYNQENIPGGFQWFGKNQTAQQTVHTISQPSRTFNFITATDWLARYSSRFNWQDNPNEGKTPDGKIAYRHNGKAIVTFYDGHTDLLTPADLRKIDERGGVNNVFWGGKQN